MAQKTTAKALVFVVYSREDEQEKSQFLSHLRVLERSGIEVWSDDQIRAGADWEEEINEAIAQAQVAVLLITANFLNSTLLMDEVVPKLLKRGRRQQLILFPVLARACHWQAVGWLAPMELRPQNRRPVWPGPPDVDAVLASIAGEIEAVVKGKPKPAPAPPQTAPKQDTGGRTVALKGGFALFSLLVILVIVVFLIVQSGNIPEIEPAVSLTGVAPPEPTPAGAVTAPAGETGAGSRVAQASCIDQYLADIAPERVLTLEAGAGERPLPVTSAERLGNESIGPLGVRLGQGGQPIGALQFSIGHQGDTFVAFTVSSVVSRNCQEISGYSNASRLGAGSTLQNWDVLQAPLPEGTYAIRFGWQGDRVQLSLRKLE